MKKDIKKIDNALLWIFGIVVIYKIVFNHDSFWSIIAISGAGLIVARFIMIWMMKSDN
jgi:hypothetical protein